jgi:hypothetical protein
MDLDRTALHAPAKCPKKLAQRSLRLNARDGRRSKAKRSCRLPPQGSPRCLQLDWRTSVLHKRHGGHSGSVSTKSGHDSDSAERWSKFTFDEPRGTNPCRSHCESLPGVPQTDALPGTGNARGTLSTGGGLAVDPIRLPFWSRSSGAKIQVDQRYWFQT